MVQGRFPRLCTVSLRTKMASHLIEEEADETDEGADERCTEDDLTTS